MSRWVPPRPAIAAWWPAWCPTSWWRRTPWRWPRRSRPSHRWRCELAKEAVNAAYETDLTQGLAHERRLFYLLFASDDQKEGMAAFMEKRSPDFTGR